MGRTVEFINGMSPAGMKSPGMVVFINPWVEVVLVVVVLKVV